MKTGQIRLKQQRLNQFLDLIETDLSKMSDVDKYSLGARFLFSTPLKLFGKKQTGEDHWKSVIDELPRVQQLFKNVINKMMHLEEGGKYPLPPIRQLLEVRDGSFKVLQETTKPDARGLRQLIATGIDDPFEEMLLSDISELGMLLNGVPQSAFRKCKNCGRLFIHLSKKTKLFHSTSCTYTYLSRQRRDRLKKKHSS
jgi:hypothetical protein